MTKPAFNRSDAQRSVKQKEHKNRELERQIYTANDHFDDGGFPPMSMVSIICCLSFTKRMLFSGPSDAKD